MATRITTCPIWGTKYEADGYFDEATQTCHVADSPRAGGGYVASEVELNASFQSFDESAKARLTTWLIEQHLQGNVQPAITEDVAKYAKNKVALPVSERAERLLKLLAREFGTVGENRDIRKNDPSYFAWTESVSEREVDFFIDYLKKQEWLEGHKRHNGTFNGMVTVKGHDRVNDKATKVDLSQAFVAMWFGPQTDEVYTQGIETAIREAGYDPVRIDRKLDVEKIDDAIIAEIRRSRFLVADFTHGDTGVRGGVYYEAGFAVGLGIPVIFTCRNDMVTKLHFDTRQYAHIVWSTPERLRFDLRDRILARIGHGPNSNGAVPLVERPPRKSLGQWLVDNVPRGTNLEPPSREGSGRPNAFLDGESL